MTNAIIIGRLLFVGLMLIIRWAIFEPLAFIGLIIHTVGQTGKESISSVAAWIKEKNDQLLNKQNEHSEAHQ